LLWYLSCLPDGTPKGKPSREFLFLLFVTVSRTYTSPFTSNVHHHNCLSLSPFTIPTVCCCLDCRSLCYISCCVVSLKQTPAPTTHHSPLTLRRDEIITFLPEGTHEKYATTTSIYTTKRTLAISASRETNFSHHKGKRKDYCFLLPSLLIPVDKHRHPSFLPLDLHR